MSCSNYYFPSLQEKIAVPKAEKGYFFFLHVLNEKSNSSFSAEYVRELVCVFVLVYYCFSTGSMVPVIRHQAGFSEAQVSNSDIRSTASKFSTKSDTDATVADRNLLNRRNNMRLRLV